MTSFNELRKQAAAKGFKGSPNPTRKQLEDFLTSLEKVKPLSAGRQSLASRFVPQPKLHRCDVCRKKFSVVIPHEGQQHCCACDHYVRWLKAFSQEK